MSGELVGKIAGDIKKGGTVEQILRRLNENQPPDEQRFYNWFFDNKSRLKEACAELGVECPPPGAAFVKRVKWVVKPVLMPRPRLETRFPDLQTSSCTRLQ